MQDSSLLEEKRQVEENRRRTEVNKDLEQEIICLLKSRGLESYGSKVRSEIRRKQHVF